MSTKPATPRGMHDLYGEKLDQYTTLATLCFKRAKRFGCQGIQTPILESIDVFKRTLGETSDVIGKEMYVLEDKGGDLLALRPEGTAPVVRALINNAIATQNPQTKWAYYGPMFRYERPQKGRYRQFHQFGVESFGIDDPFHDAEIIHLGNCLLQDLGLNGLYTLELNTLGDIGSRLSFRQALVEYFSRYQSDLSPDSLERLFKNPLRILDSKDKKDQEIAQNAPVFKDYLSKESAQYFEKVQKGLSLLNIDFKLNQKLVRGLDYYTHTAFEFTTPHLGAQATILAGGRYNRLMKELGGPDISGIGFAIGVDRILDLPCKLENQKQLTVYLMSLSEAEFETLFVLSQKLKESPVTAVTCFSYNLSKNLKKAHKEGAHFALILGEDELKQNKVLVKNLDLGTQELVCLESLSSYLLKN